MSAGANILADAIWPHRSVACGDCGRVSILQPVSCPVCSGVNLTAVDLIGTGRVEAITTVAERYTPQDLPTLTVAMVRLSQGPLILARATPDVTIGAEVELELVETASGDSVPHVVDRA